MKRPLSIILAAALAAGTMAFSVAPSAAQGVGVTMGVGNWNNDRWHSDNSWRPRHHGFRHHAAPSFSFSIGTPYPTARAYYHPRRARHCRQAYNGDLVCRYRTY